MTVELTTTANREYTVSLHYSIAFTGRGQYQVTVKANENGAEYTTHIHTTDSQFVDELNRLRQEGTHEEVQNAFHEEFYASHVEEDLTEWIEKRHTIEIEDDTLVINGETYHINMEQAVSIHRIIEGKPALIIVAETREEWVEQVIADIDGVNADFNPQIDNSVKVKDVVDTAFYSNLIELANDNVMNEKLINAIKYYFDLRN